ncbi:MAG: HAD hydrolase-like protein [Nitriliruptoraceae bacterium]
MTAALFDLDGCLVDSVGAITGSLNHMLEVLGLPRRPVRRLRGLIGPPLHEGVEQLLAEAGADPGQLDRAIVTYRARYAVVSLTDTTVVDGMAEALSRVSSAHPMHVVTSKPRAFAEPILERLGLRDWFGSVHGPGTDAANEPKTVTLARALDAEALGPGRCVMIGDRHHDVDAGRAHGVATVGVTWGTGTRHELAAADVVVDRPGQLAEVVQGLLSPSPSAGR